MGMEASFARVTSTELQKFLKKPELAYDNLLPDMCVILPTGLGNIEGIEEGVERQFAELARQLQDSPGKFPGLDIAKIKAETKKASERMLGQLKKQKTGTQSTKFFSLQKDWHVLHYVLNGTGDAGDKPLEKCILGGRELPPPADNPVDYGPLRYLTIQEVKEIVEALKRVNPQSLIEKLNRKDAESKRVYLAHTMDDPADWSYLPDLFTEFRKFYQETATARNAMMLKIV